MLKDIDFLECFKDEVPVFAWCVRVQNFKTVILSINIQNILSQIFNAVNSIVNSKTNLL